MNTMIWWILIALVIIGNVYSAHEEDLQLKKITDLQKKVDVIDLYVHKIYLDIPSAKQQNTDKNI